MSQLIKTGSVNNDVYTQSTQFSVLCNPNPGSPVFVNDNNYLTTIDNGRYRGVNTPNFHTRMRKGELLPMTPFRKFRVYGTSSGEYYWRGVIDGSGYYTYWYLNNGWTPKLQWVLDEDDMDSYVPSSYDEYVQDAAAAIYSSGHDTLTFLLELGEVKRMFFNVGRKLLTLRFPLGWRAMTNQYLEYRYGWRILNYDLRSLNRAVRNLNAGVQRFRECKGYTHTTSNTTSWQEENSSRYTDYVVTDQVTIGKRGCVVADLDVPELQFNPIVTAWELIPYSFVVDWFLSIGRSLAALSFLALRPTYVASAGLLIEVKRTMEVTVTAKTGYYTTAWQNGESLGRLNVREPSTVSLTPHITLDISFNHLIDLVALVLQRI